MGGKKNKKQIKQEKQQRKQEYQLQQQHQQAAQEDSLEENIKESSKVTTAIISTDDEDELFITDEDTNKNYNTNINSNHHYYTDEDEDEDDDEEEEEEEISRITNYWVEDTPIKEELYDREKFSSNLLSNDSLILEPKVQFNTTKKIFHFTKSPVELSHESYFDADYNGFQDYDDNGDDEDNGDNEDDQEDDDDDEQHNGNIGRLGTGTDDDEDIEEFEVGIKKNSKSTSILKRDEYYDYDELNDSSSEEIRSSRRKKNKNFYFYSHPPTSSESDTSDKDQLKKSNDGEDDDKDEDDDDEEGMNSVEEHSDIEQESLDLSSFNSTPSTSNSTTSVTNTPVTTAINTTTTTTTNVILNQTQTPPESPTTQLRQWAQRPQVKYVSRFTPPQPISPQTLSSSSERNILSTSIESDDEKSDDNDSEEDEEEDNETEEEQEETEETENEEDSEINISGSDIENEEIKNIIRNRSSMEQTLIDARAKAEAERIKLREYFNQAKVDLRQTIENVSKIFTENDGELVSTTTTTITDSGTVVVVVPQKQEQQQQPIRNELEEVSSTLIQLENKIEEIEESLKNNTSISNNKSGSPTSSTGSSKLNNSNSSKSKIKINSLLTEFVHLKQQIEKEKTEKINRDCELKDITEHLLEMASQLSKAIIYKLNVDSSNNNSVASSPLLIKHSQPVPTTTTSTTTTTNTLMMEIEFYRKQIEMLEKRLMTWKHHNELLHLELLSDKQSNSEELLNLSYKIKQVEQERDKLREKIDDLMSDIGEKEGRELIFKEKIQNLLNDKGSLSMIIEDMQKDRDYTIDRFNSLIVQIKIMGESTVDTLNDIIDQLTSEREQLQSNIELAECERSKLIDQLTLVSSQLDDSECNRKSISESHSHLLLSCESTFKALESSELKCTHFQSQLSIVNKKLIWTESEVDRLTKEINRLDKVNFSFYQQQSDDEEGNNNNTNTHNEESESDQEEVNGESFNGIKDKTNSIKSILNNERNEIIQLGSNLSLIIEKGKLNSKKTIQCLKEFILKEMEFTKSGLSNKIQEIENQKQSIISSHHHFNNEKLLLDEMNAQKSKLNEMQLKIFKIENQIINNNNNNSNNNSNQSSLVSSPPILSNQQHQLSNTGNDQPGSYESIDDRDQFTQLRKLENKIRKIEAGISEISTQTPPLTPLLSATTITTSTTTTTHTYNSGSNGNKAEIISIATDNNIPIIIQDEINLTETITTKITTPPSSSSAQTTTCINKNAETSPTTAPSEFNENIETPQSPSPSTTSSQSSTTSPIISKIKLITLNSLLMGAGSSLSIMYFRLLFNNSTGSSGNNSSSLSQIDLSNKDHVISLLKFSCKFGLFVASGYGLFKLLNLSINYKPSDYSNTNGEEEQSSSIKSKNQKTTTTTTLTSTSTKNSNNIGVIGATLLGGILGGILLFKERKSIYLLTGGLIGLTNGLIMNKLK